MNKQSFSLTELEVDACVGITFRGHINQFWDIKTGRLVRKEELRMLKRKSCPGCLKCDWYYEYINDFLCSNGVIFPSNGIEEGRLYSIRIINEHMDFESGMVDDFDLEIFEVEGTKNENN